MTAIRVLLQSARLPVFQAGSVSAVDVKAWVANQNYFIDQNLSATTFSLRASDKDQLRQALANDLNRLAGAAFESAAGIGRDPSLPRSLAWGSIRSYYAAFFAAHGLMRLFGTACVQLDNEHVDQVHAAAQAFGKAGGLTSLDAGFFAAHIEPGFDAITFCRLRDSHRDTWATLLSVLESLEAAIPSSTALSSDKIEASALLSDLKVGLTRSGSVKGNWLSVLRNSINYRHSHGVWFPYTKAADPTLLESAARAWKIHPASRSSTTQAVDLNCFFEVSSTLVALLRELTTSAAALNVPLSPTFANGCLKLLNEARTPRKRTAGAI